MQLLAIDDRGVLRELVEPLLPRTPVVAVPPVPGQVLETDTELLDVPREW
jgi:hypothetical protein